MQKKVADEDLLGEKFLSNISVDIVIFGFHNRQLKILLLRFKNTSLYALPGGFINEQEEDIEDAVERVLTERTGIKDIYLEQFGVFGSKKRAFGETHKHIHESAGKTTELNQWITQRFVTVGYYALVNLKDTIPNPDDVSDFCGWIDINEIPTLAFDHKSIIEKALQSLRMMLDLKLAVFNLMPESFTMNDLQSLYETILGKKLQRTNFQRKMLSLGILERLDKHWTGGAHKAAYLYRFDKNKYNEMQREEMNIKVM
jgi:hypothetical protein